MARVYGRARSRGLQVELRAQDQRRPDPGSPAKEIIGELQALFARHNAGAALSAKAVFKPTKEFYTVRHRNFELGMLNFEFNQLSDFQFQLFLPVVPVAASVKTKLRRGGTGEE